MGSITVHDSDCAIYNEPAYPKGECNCSISEGKGVAHLTFPYPKTPYKNPRNSSNLAQSTRLA